MPSILSVPENPESDTLEVTLYKEGLVIDSRVIEFDRYGVRFECTIEGRKLTIRLVAGQFREFHGEGWNKEMHFRLYDSEVEKIPSFDLSAPYMYNGLKNEKPPFDVKRVDIAPHVTIIKEWAFYSCETLETCTMGDNVEEIEYLAFYGCHNLNNIKLSKALRVIGNSAFWSCRSIDCMFIPSSVEKIGYKAFQYCTNMRIFMLPPNIQLNKIGYQIVGGCDSLIGSDQAIARGQLTETFPCYNTKIQMDILNNIKHRFDHLPFLRVCTDPNVTVSMIQNIKRKHGTIAFHQTDGSFGLTPLHIVTGVNTFVDEDVIIACFDANPSALFLDDTKGCTPLDHLWTDSQVDTIVHLMQDLCINRLRV